MGARRVAPDYLFIHFFFPSSLFPSPSFPVLYVFPYYVFSTPYSFVHINSSGVDLPIWCIYFIHLLFFLSSFHLSIKQRYNAISVRERWKMWAIPTRRAKVFVECSSSCNIQSSLTPLLTSYALRLSFLFFALLDIRCFTSPALYHNDRIFVGFRDDFSSQIISRKAINLLNILIVKKTLSHFAAN